MSNHQPLQIAMGFESIDNPSIKTHNPSISIGTSLENWRIIDRKTSGNGRKAVLFVGLQEYRFIVDVSSDNHPTNQTFHPIIEARNRESSTNRQLFFDNHQPAGTETRGKV